METTSTAGENPLPDDPLLNGSPQEQRPTSPPPAPLEPESNDWHAAIAAGEWSRLEQMISKYDVKFFKRKRERLERQKAQQEREAAWLFDQKQAGSNRPDCPGSPTNAHIMSEDATGGSFSESPSVSRRPSPFHSSRLRKRLQSVYDRSTCLTFGSGRNYNSKDQPFPLLGQDESGKTPFHLACFIKTAPNKLLLQLLILERRAASVPDEQGRLPLHTAVATNRFNHVLAKIIKAHPNALKSKDTLGRSPVAFAVKLAKDRMHREFLFLNNAPNSTDTELSWSHSFTKNQKHFQFLQESIWTTVGFLVSELARRGKSLVPSEHELLIEALEAGAPPNVIGHFLATSAKYICVDDELACNAIYWTIQRHYPLGILQQMLSTCRQKTTMIVDATHKALVAHYQEGCHTKYGGAEPYGKELIDWAKKREERCLPAKGNVVDDADSGSGFLEGVSDAVIDWWEKLQYLVAYCAYGNEYQDNEQIAEHHLVHASLCVASSPPSLVQLLMIIYPQAKRDVCPVYKALPIHLICSRWKYDLLQHQPQDPDVIGRTIKQLLVGEAKDHVFVQHRTRLPLHLALSASQTWSMVSVLIEKFPSSVGIRDPSTRLFPFQLAALKQPPKILALMLRTRFSPKEWRKLSLADRKKQYLNAEEIQGVRQLMTIWELLRKHPAAIQGRYLSRQHHGCDGYIYRKDVAGVGRVAAHYLAWCYTQRPADGTWEIRPNNIKILRDAIMDGYISKGLEPWWNRLKYWIWYCYPGDSDSLPRVDDYLLHAALYNPDTPPFVAELLLELYPSSVTFPVPGTGNYPLHIAAGTVSHVQQSFEIPTKMDSMHLVLLAYPRAARLKSNGRLPLHIGILRGKTWKELCPLVEEVPETLFVPDHLTGLFPFQLMAACRTSSKDQRLRVGRMIEKLTQNVDMEEMLSADRGRLLKGVQKNYQAEVLTSIYEMLRYGPGVIARLSHSGFDVSRMEWVTQMSQPTYETKQPGGIASILDDYLASAASGSADITPKVRAKSPRKTPERKQNAWSLSSFLDAPPLETPEPIRQKVPSLTTFFHSGMGGSMRSLSSKEKGYGADLFDSSISKPTYDDDAMSYMNASVSSGNLMFSPIRHDQSPSNSITSLGVTPNSVDINAGLTPKKKRGRRPHKPKEAQINFPNL